MSPSASPDLIVGPALSDRLECLRTIAAEAREMARRAEATGASSKVAPLLLLARHYEAEEQRLRRELGGGDPSPDEAGGGR